jgi:flagellin-like hook-associated protein FlgL
LATQGASSLLTSAQRQDLGNQVDQYLQQAVTLANTQYGGAYIFAGSSQSSTAPVSTTGSPISAVTFSGNEQSQAPMVLNGQSYAFSPTLQQAFNYNATDGSPNVFQTLITLRDTIKNGLVSDESAQSINTASQVIYGAGSPTPTTLAHSSSFLVPPKPDSNGNYSISIENTDAAGADHTNTYTFTDLSTVDDAVPPAAATTASIVGAINAKTATTGLTATFNAQTQRFALTNAGGGAISVSDVASTPPTATDTGNLTNVFNLTATASLPQTVSTQLGDIDNALEVTLSARSLVGSGIDTLAQINSGLSTGVVNDTAVQSGIEDINVPQATTQFTATQAALTASYSTTTRLESKDLFDYL